MVMDNGEREDGGGGGGGGGGVGGELVEKLHVVQEIVGVIESVAQFGDYRRTHKKDCSGIVRRIKLLLPLLEEIRDLETPIPETGIAWLCSLKKVLLCARKLLKMCNEGSKIYLALESEAVMIRFHTVYDKFSQALGDFPSVEIDVSDELKEQIELMCVQLRRARKRTDTQDIELAMDMMVVFSKKDDRNADSAIIERLAKKLDLHTVEDLKIETIAVRNLVRERGGQNADTTQQIIEILNKFKQIAGMELTNVLDDPVMPKMLEKCPSLLIPHEFLCPITLEIMTDPVIVASGQTYERESILKWFDSNHRTCPKTRQTLAHLSIAPNFALKNIILQWCEKNNFQLPEKPDSSVQEISSSEHKEEISSLVENLYSSLLELQRKAVKKIRMLSKENPENRVLIAKNGAILPLVQLLSYPDSKIQEHAVTALLNLSIDEANKKLIAREGAIPAIIEILQKGSTEAKENSAAALFSLSMLDEIKITVGLSDGIPPLVALLQNGTIRGKKDAATALFNLSLNQENKARAINAGIIPPLRQLLKDRNLGMVDEALSIFLLLASHPDGRQEIGELSFIENLVEFIQKGTPKNKECATSVLLELGSNNSSFILAALQFGVYEHLIEIAKSGTNRAQRKANAVLQLISTSEQIP
ncbi:U-box domain-containing protein 15 [Quercus lobata]|uniref:U-box domain-containing protein 15 n=1 Tax=Quercus lobata TaxID=97700 RepID=UPI001248D24E|nr:U-box domain-containing protein 15 [Quercus lobata]XP_030955731.1 U-box domain-containing protein 15 [Quercus lobata]